MSAVNQVNVQDFCNVQPFGAFLLDVADSHSSMIKRRELARPSQLHNLVTRVLVSSLYRPQY